jgi:ketosteroid isomerase-like protein
MRPTTEIEQEITDIVNRETRAWDTKDVELLITIFHPDMVWPWPPDGNAHDPLQWIFVMGRFGAPRWKTVWQELFDSHTLIRNRRTIKTIKISEQGDGAFAVVDVDTLWRDREGKDFHWKGRACKVYSRVREEWKMTMHTGLLEY